MKQIPERYFSYAYQFTVLIAIIAMTFVVGDSREMLLGALINAFIITSLNNNVNNPKIEPTTPRLTS